MFHSGCGRESSSPVLPSSTFSPPSISIFTMQTGNFIYLILPLLIFGNLAHGHFYNEDGWAAAGRYMREAIDPKVDPCEDFYRYACGKWEDKYNGTYRNEVDKAVEDAIKYLIKAIKRIQPENPNTPAYQKRLQTFYKQCVDATEEEDVILNEIYNQIQKLIGPMPLVSGQNNGNFTNPYKLMGYMQQFFNTSIMVFANVEREADGCHFRPILTLNPAKPKESHMVSENSSLTQKLLQMALSQNGDQTRFFAQIKKLMQLESDLLRLLSKANFSWATYEVDNILKVFHKNDSSGWTWLDYFDGLLPDHAYDTWREPIQNLKGKPRKTRVTFRYAAYFKGLDKIIQEYGSQTMLDYAYWRAMRNYLEYFLDAPQYYSKKNITFASIDRQCVDYVLQYASAAAARLYFDSYGSNAFDWKYDVELIAQAVTSAFRYMIYNADWLDLEDKTHIMNKLKMISIDSGIPEWLLNDTAVEDHTPPFDPSRSTFENDLLMFRDKFVWKMHPLWTNESIETVPGVVKGTKADILLDPEPNFIPYAQYSEQRIEVWLGAILPPLYNYSYPLALKFGAIGAIVGEQLMRAFDPDEITERIGIKKLLKLEAVILYRLRRECVALTQPLFRRCLGEPNAQSTVDSTAECMRMSQLLLELTADTEGMKLAYMAYAFMTQTVGREPALPGLSDYDADQLFFMSYARLLCGVREQVEIALSNFPAFGRAWNCKAGSKFAPEYRCTLWSNASDMAIGRRDEV